METIEKRAREYAHQYRRDAHDLKGERADAAFAAYCQGAEDEHEVLTKWNDPKEPPERGKDVLLKLRYEAGAEPSYTVGYWNGIYYGDALGADTEIIGWREIHE